jgi:hypothetical protein
LTGESFGADAATLPLLELLELLLESEDESASFTNQTPPMPALAVLVAPL